MNGMERNEIMKKHLYVEKTIEWEEIYKRNYCMAEDAKVQIIKNGIILPARKEKVPGMIDYATAGGVCDENFQFIAGWTRKCVEGGMNKSCLNSYQVEESELQIKHERVVFGGVIDSHFGHFFTEGLSRLWWVVQHPDDYEKLVFVMTNEVKDYFSVLYQLLEIPEEKVEYVESPVRYDEVLVPDETMYLWSGYKKELNIVYDKIVSNLPKSPYEKVYFTRTQFVKQDCINEEYFEGYFRDKGYQIVAPEQLPVIEQLSIAAGAKEVACVCGSLSHFALFAAPRTKYIILNRVRDHYFVPQILINQMRNIEDVFIDIADNYFPVRFNRGCFLMQPNKFWNAWLVDNGEEEQYLTNEQKANNAYLYLLKWHELYTTKGAMSTVVDYDVCDFLDYMDRALGGNGVSRKKYGFRSRRSELMAKIEQLKNKNEEQEKKIKRLRKKLKKADNLSEQLKKKEEEIERLNMELDVMKKSLVGRLRKKIVDMLKS